MHCNNKTLSMSITYGSVIYCTKKTSNGDELTDMLRVHFICNRNGSVPQKSRKELNSILRNVFPLAETYEI